MIELRPPMTDSQKIRHIKAIIDKYCDPNVEIYADDAIEAIIDIIGWTPGAS